MDVREWCRLHGFQIRITLNERGNSMWLSADEFTARLGGNSGRIHPHGMHGVAKGADAAIQELVKVLRGKTITTIAARGSKRGEPATIPQDLTYTVED